MKIQTAGTPCSTDQVVALIGLIAEAKHIGSRREGDLSRKRERLVRSERSAGPKRFTRRTRVQTQREWQKFSKYKNGILNLFLSEIGAFQKGTGQYRSGSKSAKGGRLTKKLRGTIKDAYYAAYGMGLASAGSAGRLASGHSRHDVRGGKHGVPITAEDRNWILSAVKHEYKFLDKFVADIVAKRGRMPYPRRAKMYVDSIDNIFHSGKMQGLPGSTSLFFWVTSKRKNVCSSCKFLEQSSPFTKDRLPTMPRSGATRCLSNCGCRVVIRHASQSRIAKVRRSLLSRAYYMNRLKRIKQA